MNLPFIIVSVLALALGTLSVVLSLLVGRRYHQINRENSDTLNEFREDVRRMRDRASNQGRQIGDLQTDLQRLEATTGGFWSTALGTVLQIRQMSDAHIANSLAHLTETGREGGEAWDNLRTEQKRRARDQRLSPTYQVEIGIERPIDVLRRLAGEPIQVEAKGVDKVEQRGPMTVNQAIAEAQDAMPLAGKIDWQEVDKLVLGLIERVGLSNLKHDLWKLRHLLGRGRKGK